MPESEIVPELKQIVGAMVFAANRPLSVREIHRCLLDVAERQGKETAAFGSAKPGDVKAAILELQADLSRQPYGFGLQEVARGYRLQSDASCGKWLKQLLDKNKPRRLSMPALETLAVIAYRQPLTRADIEGVRGVAVDHVVKLLMELHLIRIVGRSDLPGRPFLYGTTQNFLDHFGLKSLKDLEQMAPGILASLERQKERARVAALQAEQEARGPDDEGQDAPGDEDEDEEDDEGA
jgi:segregation and condensation protein B